MILAHGIGTRADLPISVTLAAIGAGLAVAVSFVALAVLWKTPRLDGDHHGRPAPGWLQRAADSGGLRLAVQTLMLGIVLFIYAAALFGTQSARNITPWAFFVSFWVGLVPLSILFGPVWRYVNPLRALHAGLASALRLDSERGSRRLPDWVGYWPAAVSILGFAWFELVYRYRDVPLNIGWFLLVYAVVHVTAALIYGRGWFERGDGFEVYSTLLGHLSPIGRRADRRVVFRNPLEGLDAIKPLAGLSAVVIALVGSTSYDGLSRTRWYSDNVPEGMAAGTAALILVVALIWLIYLAGTWSATTTPTATGEVLEPAAFAHTIVPVVAAYAIAHYFSLLIFDGQMTFILTSDPFGNGADYFGTAHDTVNYLLVSTRTIAVVQVVAIVTGHVLAVASAHDRGVRLFSYREAVRTQIPLLAAMVTLTLIAIGLVLSV